MNEQETQPDISIFLASAIHDMKNSISMMIGFLEKTLADVDPASFPAYRGMAHMLYETKRINSNLIQLLTLYKVGSHLYPFDPLPHALEDFVEEIVSQNRPLLDAKGIAIEVDCDAGVTRDFDEDLVGGVINHALNNAFHYTRDRVRLIVRESDGFVEFRVEDNGEGYPPAMLAEGGEAMRGVDFRGGSTGLGLYFSAAVAKLHKTRSRSGTILLENGGAWGGGCFVMRLP